MKAQFKSPFRCTTPGKNFGKPMNWYTLTGTDAELEAFKTFQGANYQEDENGRPMFSSLAHSMAKGTIGSIRQGNIQVVSLTEYPDAKPLLLPASADVTVAKNGSHWISTEQLEKLIENDSVSDSSSEIKALYTFIEQKKVVAAKKTESNIGG